ncbi:MAG TPA: PIN domain nuclease [Casimicrobiaceae bacterium]|nr:PIN domain nuclease [Casimicrobiaceae bacterium]
MILVDSSVWIDYFRGGSTDQTDKLDALLGIDLISVGDLILTEVLQGFDDEPTFDRVRRLMATLDFVVIGGADVAVEAARNHRRLRSLGITTRKTIDTLIATRCIVSGHSLLHDDRDFEVFEKHLGLRCV